MTIVDLLESSGVVAGVFGVVGYLYRAKEARRDEEIREMKVRLDRVETNVHALGLDGARRDERLDNLKSDIRHLITMVEKL